MKYKVVSLGVDTFLKSPTGVVLPYSLAAYAWWQTTYSAFLLQGPTKEGMN